MTKSEAIILESKIDELFSKKLGENCEVSMALTGALRISIDNGFFNIKTDKEAVDWVKWNGDYGDLISCINSAILAIRENKEKIDELMKSYKEPLNEEQP